MAVSAREAERPREHQPGTVPMSARLHTQRGVGMIEVLVTILISAFGLLAIAGLQARMHIAEMESAQRAQATMLLRYITDRISANRKNAMAYVTATPVGADSGVQDCTGLNGAALDL